MSRPFSLEGSYYSTLWFWRHRLANQKRYKLRCVKERAPLTRGNQFTIDLNSSRSSTCFHHSLQKIYFILSRKLQHTIPPTERVIKYLHKGGMCLLHGLLHSLRNNSLVTKEASKLMHVALTLFGKLTPSYLESINIQSLSLKLLQRIIHNREYNYFAWASILGNVICFHLKSCCMACMPSFIDSTNQVINICMLLQCNWSLFHILS